MARDPSKLRAFHLADALVLDVYKATQEFPISERFGLQSQIRRSAVSVVANVVEGSARPTERGYLHFVAIAIASASEARYLIDVAIRLEFIQANIGAELVDRYSHVVRALQALVCGIRSLKPEA